MVVDRIPYPFRGRDGCNNGGGKGLFKKYFIDRHGACHFNSKESRRYLGDRIASDHCLFASLDVALKKTDIWLCGESWRIHSFSKNCKHANGLVIFAPTSDDGVIHCIPRPLVATDVSSVADEDPSLGSFSGFLSASIDVNMIGCVFLKPFRTVKSTPNCVLAMRVSLHALDAVLVCQSDVSAWV